MAEDSFKTTDTALATFLIVKNCILERIDYSSPRYEYHFKNHSSVRELAQSYLIGQGLADAATLIRVNKKLIRILHNRLQWRDE
jgi:hypothetical protein